MLSLQGVTKRYRHHVAVDQVSLTVPEGKTTVLLGTSGSGKSTLIRMMSGLILPDSGKVEFRGEDLRRSDLQKIRQGLGYVIQDGGLFPHLTARGNLSLLPKVIGWPREKIEARIAVLCELTRFPVDGLDRFPGQLSGGQRQRVGLMRALMLDPPVLLLDEPLGALDPIVRRELQEDLQAIFSRLRKTVVIVTHDLGEAGFFGDSIVLMKEGRIVQHGTLSDLVESPADPFVTRFVNAQRSPLEALGRT